MRKKYPPVVPLELHTVLLTYKLQQPTNQVREEQNDINMEEHLPFVGYQKPKASSSKYAFFLFVTCDIDLILIHRKIFCRKSNSSTLRPLLCSTPHLTAGRRSSLLDPHQPPLLLILNALLHLECSTLRCIQDVVKFL